MLLEITMLLNTPIYFNKSKFITININKKYKNMILNYKKNKFNLL
jgi:hypothetical protein